MRRYSQPQITDTKIVNIDSLRGIAAKNIDIISSRTTICREVEVDIEPIECPCLLAENENQIFGSNPLYINIFERLSTSEVTHKG